MTHIIVGTAGHIDHGKTALVKALTGVETDRLKEEQERGISIDLGFAHLDLEGVRAAFIDVPGHERFVKNMLAGATAIDVVLLAIAADESIKPQTREHFDICRLLGIERGIVVLTKADLVDQDMLGLVKLEAAELVAGSFLEDAPLLAVSAKTGNGVEDLKRELQRMAMEVKTRRGDGPFRLPVDRSFAVHGFGTVVTGAIGSGRVRTDEELTILPGGHRVRVRGIETHGESVSSAGAGQRSAINLAGIDATEIHRGQVLAPPGRFQATSEAGCRLDLLASAPPLKHRAPLHFHAGAAVSKAEIRLLTGEAIVPGSSALVKLVFAEPMVLLPGDRFIVRRYSPLETMGGGVVVDPFPPPGRRASLAEHLAFFEQADAAGRIALLLDRAPFGLSAAELARWGFTDAELRDAPAIAPSRANALRQSIVSTLKKFHADQPLLPGMPKEELRSRLLAAAPSGLLDTLLSGLDEVAVERDFVRLRTHRLHLKSEEDEALQRIEEAFRHAGLSAPAMTDVLAKSGIEPNRARSLLQILLRDGRLVRVTTELVFHRSAMEALSGVLAQRRGARFSVPDFKDWTGVSRKYAIPLLEYLDRTRVTRREGDQRLIL